MAKAKGKKKKKGGSSLGTFLALATAAGVIIGLGLIFKAAIAKEFKGFRDKLDSLSPGGFTYPTKYEEYVLKYSKEYDCDPVLVFSVINVESKFDPEATSKAGARGLMQIMSDAYDWIKFRLDDGREHTYDDMYDPELNIQYGTYYLSFLMERYDGSIDLTAAAYNCGLGQVDSWLAEGIISAEDFDPEDIPEGFGETEYYVKKVRRNYNEYKKILAERGELDFESTSLQ
ncbi:MAG: lytic transglycosylase domain-containing protein [Ruminococcus sp.]|nr:lytic transglycosylase domain-containing protein [Ruminococcus sp.]